MKKAVGGCLAVALPVLVLGAGSFWLLVLRPAWNAGNALVQAARQWAELAQMDLQISNHDAFSPPADDVIEAEVLQRFVAVQQTMDERMGDNLKRLDLKYRELRAWRLSESMPENPGWVMYATGRAGGGERRTRYSALGFAR